MVEISRRSDGCAVIRLHGELWLGSSAELAACIDELIDAGTRDVLVELSDLTLLTADGVSVLLQGDEQLRAVGGSLRVCNPAGVVATVVELTPLRERLEA